MTSTGITEVEARFQAGTETRADFRRLLSHAKTTPTVARTIEMLHEAGREFDRLIVATNPVTGAHPIRFTVGGAL